MPIGDKSFFTTLHYGGRLFNSNGNNKSNKQLFYWTIDKMRLLGTSGQLELFKSLHAPSIHEMRGEYHGHYFGADGHFISNAIWHITCNRNWTSGIWLGKSFHPDSQTAGYGFNNLSKFGMRLRRWPMKTGIGPSRYDGKDVYALNYRYYYSAAGIVNMQDEIRRIENGLYLAVGHWRLPIGIPMASVWFALTGPVGPYDPNGALL